MIVTTVRPEDFSYMPSIGLMKGYYTYRKLSENNYSIAISYDEDALGTTRPNTGKILADKKVNVTIDIFDNAEKTPIYCNIVGGSIDGLGKTTTPILRESTSFSIKGAYTPSLIVNMLDTVSEEYTLNNIAKINASNHCLTMFTNWDGESNVDNGEYLSVLCIDNKDLVNTTGVWIYIEWVQMEDYIKADSDGNLIFHFHNQSMTDGEIVDNILKEVMEDVYIGNFARLLKYESDASLVDYDNNIQVFIDNSKSGYGDGMFYIEIFEDEDNKSIEELNINTIEDGVFEAPENVLYNKVNLTIPKREYVLDLTRNGIVAGSDAISPSGTIAPIKPDGYLISQIRGGVRISDITIDIESNGTEGYNSTNGFYNEVIINTNVMDNAYIFPKVSLSIGSINCDKDTIRYDESYIEACIYYSDIGDNLFYLSVDGTNYNQYSNGDDFEIPIRLGKFLTKIYYKIKNVNTNNFSKVCAIDLPIEPMILNAISTPKFNITKVSDTRIGIALENIELVDYNFKCNVIINNEEHIINDTDNTQIIIDIKDPYISVESYFSKITDSILQEGKHSQFVVDVNAVSTIEIVDVEYRDPSYIYSKVPTKYYGIYLTLLKLLSDSGETLLQDCVSACKSSSHKLIALWNMFNAACAAYLNDNEKLAELLIKNIVSQLNIMYDENYDFIQHRVFIGNYTLNNKNNPNEFNTIDLSNLTPSEYDVCSELELKFTIQQTSDIHYIMLPPELDLKYVSFGDTIKTVLFDAENNINLYKERSWRMADKDTDGTIYWYYSSAGAFNDIITIICKYK